MLTHPLSMPKIIGECVDLVRTDLLAELQAYDSTIETINYMHGNIKEVIKRLQEYTDNSVYRRQKFPIVILIEDVIINRANNNYYGNTQGMNIIIANHTLPVYTSMQREDKNFAPILRKIYNRMLYRMSRHPNFPVQGMDKINHTVAERKYWGADDNTKNKLGDYIDAIDMYNINIPVNFNYCRPETINNIQNN